MPGDAGPVVDTLGRPVRDLRISVTDRCNFRCTYCMPKEVFHRDFLYLDRSALLDFDEIERVARSFARHGVTKLRLTGGEPLLRRGLEDLIARLAAIPGIDDLAMTTNGALLERKAQALAAAGLRRVTVSLDSLDDAVFMAMNDVGFSAQQVLEGIAAAADAGLGPIKVNMVVKRGINDASVVDMARHFKGTGHTLRFIEYMDVGTTNGWRLDDVVTAADIVDILDQEFGVDPVEPSYTGEVATRWRYRDGSGEVGVIGSVTKPFCGDCTRARLSAEGMLYTCLFAAAGTDLRELVRSDHDGRTVDEALDERIETLWSDRTDRYSETRSSFTDGITDGVAEAVTTGLTIRPAGARPAGTRPVRVEMSHIGG